MKPETKKLAISLLINSILLVVLYFVAAKKFPYIWVIYLAAGAGLGLYYVIYNKGFSGKGVTPDMLPSTMSLAEKEAFIEDSRKRLHNSRWVLTLLVPILITFMLDMLYLYLFPYVEAIFS